VHICLFAYMYESTFTAYIYTHKYIYIHIHIQTYLHKKILREDPGAARRWCTGRSRAQPNSINPCTTVFCRCSCLSTLSWYFFFVLHWRETSPLEFPVVFSRSPPQLFAVAAACLPRVLQFFFFGRCSCLSTLSWVFFVFLIESDCRLRIASRNFFSSSRCLFWWHFIDYRYWVSILSQFVWFSFKFAWAR